MVSSSPTIIGDQEDIVFAMGQSDQDAAAAMIKQGVLSVFRSLAKGGRRRP